MNINIKRSLLYTAIIGAIAWSCTDDFGELNTDPNIISDPDLGFMFANVQSNLSESYIQWWEDDYVHLMRYSQHTIPLEGNDIDFNNVNERADRRNIYYTDIGYNTSDIRRLIDLKEGADRESHNVMYHTTYIPEIYYGLRVTDVYGSIAYSEAWGGREGDYTAKFDSQEELFTDWISKLDEAIDVLSNANVETVRFGDGDFLYNNDWTKWSKLANALKLKIAARLVKADPNWAQQIVQAVENSPVGTFESEDDEFIFSPGPEYIGRSYDFNTTPHGTLNFVNLLKETNDPRLKIYFDPNDFSEDAIDDMMAAGIALPEIVDSENDPLYRYHGGPASPDRAGESEYFLPVTFDNTVFTQLSHINRRFFNPGFDGGSGYMIEALVSYAEVCLLKAEFIALGYMNGNAEEWYYKGITASIRMMNNIAENAGVENFDPVTEEMIADYLADEKVSLTGSASEQLEKIYAQQYINYFKQPTETYTLVRRTGFPKVGSNLLEWEEFTSGGSPLAIPRRFPYLRPNNDLIVQDWEESMVEQGFTPGGATPDMLQNQRIWYDQNSPGYGQGQF
jgi:hypothetical protein